MSQFQRYIGIDYSGAETPTSSLAGLRVYEADQHCLPDEVTPPPSPRKYWTRRGIAEWLREQLLKPEPTIVGIDHAFSFPVQYFEMHGLPLPKLDTARPSAQYECNIPGISAAVINKTPAPIHHNPP